MEQQSISLLQSPFQLPPLMLPYPWSPKFSLSSCHCGTSSPGIWESQETWKTKCSTSCSRYLQLRANPFTAFCIPSVQDFALQRGGNRSVLTHVPHGRQADNALFSLSFLPDYGVTFSQCCSGPWSLSKRASFLYIALRQPAYLLLKIFPTLC